MRHTLNKKIFAIVLLSFAFFILFAPSTDVQAGEDKAFTEGRSLVPCGSDTTDFKKSSTGRLEGGEVVNPCGFNDFLKLINKVVNFFFVVLAVPIAAILFAYAGILLVFSGGETSKMQKAKGIFTSVAVGLLLAGACWLIVHLILETVGYTGEWFGFE